MLEPYEVKVSCTVLRGEGNHKIPNLPDDWEKLRRIAMQFFPSGYAERSAMK